jgi:hypothetical protein
MCGRESGRRDHRALGQQADVLGMLRVSTQADARNARAGTADIADAAVVIAATLGAIIWTSAPDDLRALIDAQDVKPAPVLRTT